MNIPGAYVWAVYGMLADGDGGFAFFFHDDP